MYSSLISFFVATYGARVADIDFVVFFCFVITLP